MAGLNDVVAQQIMGEIDTLTKQIDQQIGRMASVIRETNKAAELIQESGNEAIRNTREAARQAQIEGAARAEAQMVTAAARALNEVAGAVATKSATKWILAGVALAGVMAVCAGWAGYSKGKEAGQAIGFASARQEAVINAWASTKEGQLAHKLAQAGSIQKLANCTGKGWKEKDGICFPFPADDGVHGWSMQH